MPWELTHVRLRGNIPAKTKFTGECAKCKCTSKPLPRCGACRDPTALYCSFKRQKAHLRKHTRQFAKVNMQLVQKPARNRARKCCLCYTAVYCSKKCRKHDEPIHVDECLQKEKESGPDLILSEPAETLRKFTNRNRPDKMQLRCYQ